MLTIALLAALMPTPAPQNMCALERRESGALEFVCGATAQGEGRRVLVDGVDCGRWDRHGKALRWTGCERMQRSMERE